MEKVLNIVLDGWAAPSFPHQLYDNLLDTYNAIQRGDSVIWTKCTHFCALKYGYKIVCYVKTQPHEITAGVCEGASKEINKDDNLEELLLAGVFEWFNPEDYKWMK